MAQITTVTSNLAIPQDKLTICNNALIATGNNPCSVADDNSDEWRVASMGYERWVSYMLYNGNWRFASAAPTELVRVGDSDFPGFCDVFAKPSNCLFLRNVYRTDLASYVQPSLAWSMPAQDVIAPPLAYRLISDQIHCVAPEGVSAIFNPFPTGAEPLSIGFIEALTTFVESTVYHGLNEEHDNGERSFARAEKMSEMALSRDESQEPRRVMFRSSLIEARRSRRRGSWGWR